MDEGIDKKDGQIVNELQDTKGVIKLENSPDDKIVKETNDIVKPDNTDDIIKPEKSHTHPIEASPSSPPSPQFESDDANNTEEKALIIKAKEKTSQSILSMSPDSNDKDESNKLEQLFTCPHCKFESTSENEYQRHIVLIHPRRPGYPNTALG
jgi:hypothetical protein